MKALPPPLFDSAFLHEVACAIERRGKAIRNRGRLDCSRVEEDCGERLNFDFDDGVRIRLSIWWDGVMWLSVTKPGPRRTGGWALHLQFHSHVAEFDGYEVCRCFEQTIANPVNARAIWPSFSSIR